MKALYRLSDSVTVEIESDSVMDLVDKLTVIKDSIGPEPCGKCHGVDTCPQSRKVGDDVFYEIKCNHCGAVLQLGVSKADKTLYKKRMKTDSKGKAVKDGDKAVYLPNNGWLKWNNEKKVME